MCQVLTGHGGMDRQDVGAVLDVALSGDGVLAATASDDFSVKVWELEDQECLHTLMVGCGGAGAGVLASIMGGRGRRNSCVGWHVFDCEWHVQPNGEHVASCQKLNHGGGGGGGGGDVAPAHWW